MGVLKNTSTLFAQAFRAIDKVAYEEFGSRSFRATKEIFRNCIQKSLGHNVSAFRIVLLQCERQEKHNGRTHGENHERVDVGVSAGL